MTSLINNSRKSLRYAPPPVRVVERAVTYEAAPIWTPFPGPQTDAYNSEADVIGYGGAGGGGKTDLALGFAGTKHRKSIIFRREFPQTRDMIERSRAIYNAGDQAHSDDSYNESLHIWRLKHEVKRIVEFGACQLEKHKEKQRGNPHDLYVFDEATQFTESIIRFITAWNRTAIPGQKCRQLFTFNPPTDEAGRWVIRYFLPWMAYLYPDLEECKTYTGAPAKPGELRWYVVDAGVDVEVPEGTKNARSRTFFPAKVEDNPAMMAQGYDATLESLPEPLRSQMRYGLFTAGQEADPWQAIPRAWVLAAQKRWTEQRPNVPLLAVGQDVARGGKDKTVNARLYGTWFAPLEKVPGAHTPDGPTAAALVANDVIIATLGVAVDITGGTGGSSYDSLKSIDKAKVTPINYAESAGDLTDRSKKMRFRNVRAAMYWKFREALDPEQGDNIALPPDPELLADLCTPKWSLTSGGILIESKDDIRERLGRSPDTADAVVQAHWLVVNPSKATQILDFLKRQAAKANA